jgi:hypothetical protein
MLQKPSFQNNRRPSMGQYKPMACTPEISQKPAGATRKFKVNNHLKTD